MTRRLKRIAPLQAAKILGILYAAMGLIFVPFFLLAAAAGAFAQAGSEEARAAGAVAAGMMVVMGLLAPVIYGVMGFVVGALGAFVYNLIARWVGGLEFEFEEVPVVTARSASASDSSV